MKKTIIAILILSAVMLLICSCTRGKKETEPKLSEKVIGKELICKAEGYEATAVFSENGEFSLRESYFEKFASGKGAVRIPVAKTSTGTYKAMPDNYVAVSTAKETVLIGENVTEEEKSRVREMFSAELGEGKITGEQYDKYMAFLGGDEFSDQLTGNISRYFRIDTDALSFAEAEN